jgi:hypothetical protein
MSSSGPPADETTDDDSERVPVEDRDRDTDDVQTPNTVLNALLGALVTATTALFVPFSPVLGGAAAGYLQGGETSDGLKIGAISGLIALVPLLFLLLIVLVFLPVFGPPRGAVIFLFFAAVVLGLVVIAAIVLNLVVG